MAAALAPASAIDLKSPNTYSVRLGASILQEGEGKRYRNVRYNYKPQPAKGATVSTKLLPGKQANTSSLSVKEGDKEWDYTGRHREADDMYVLVVSGEGKKVVTLEKLGGSHSVNLTRSPEDNNVESLARKHPYITGEDSDHEDDGMFGGESDTEDAAPDANNPFDFRHFLKSVEEEPQRDEPSSQKSTVGTPTPHQRTPTVTQLPRSAKPTPASMAAKKRKTPSAAATRPNPKNPKRVRAGEDPPLKSTPSAKSPPPRKISTPVPEVRIDRKASIRQPAAPSIEQTSHPEDEDDGELILENSTADTNQKSTHLSAMSLALSGALGGRGAGPISLRSAASSPASALNSPHLNNAANQEGQEFEFGGESSPVQEQHEFEFVDHDDDDEDDEDRGGDGDVEDAEFPSPPQPEQPRQQPPPPPAQPRSRRASLAMQGADDEDDMEAQLALAMAADEEDEEPAPLGRVDESDEDVSEEE